jgi:hypothetical protein
MGKFKKRAIILHEYDFDIIHKVGKVNRDVGGLSWNQFLTRRLGFVGMMIKI